MDEAQAPSNFEAIRQIILRRIDFLLVEARSANPMRDQTITYAMRVVSNYCAVGKDASSSHIKRFNQRISRKALELKQSIPFDEWQSQTINEHQEPLKTIWQWILDNKNSLTSESILNRFNKYPMIIITKEEDSELNKLGLRSSGSPEERYHAAGIEILDAASLSL